MTVVPDEVARLRFLQRVIRRERELLQETTAALFDGHAARVPAETRALRLGRCPRVRCLRRSPSV